MGGWVARCSRRRSRAGRQADLLILVLEDEAVRVEVDSPIDVSVVVDALAGRLHAVALERRVAAVGAPAEDKALAVRDAVDGAVLGRPCW